MENLSHSGGGGGSLDEDFEAGETPNTREMLFTHLRRHTRRRHVNTESEGQTTETHGRDKLSL